MRLLLLHLSDFHIRPESHFEFRKIDEFINALSICSSFDECVIIFSGDLANRATLGEYSRADFLLGKLISKLKSRFKLEYIPLYSVPGNHDIVLTESCRTRAQIQEYYDNGCIDDYVETELHLMDNYFTNGKIKSNQWHDRLLDRKLRTLGGTTIQFNLINTALFSTLEPDDKQLHYFPENKLHLLQKDSSAHIAITVMHHGLEWFSWDCKNKLETAIYDNSEFLFTGHDHYGASREVKLNNTPGIWTSAAGAMDFASMEFKDSFNALVVNTESEEFSGYMFEWDPEKCIYFHTQLTENSKITKKTNGISVLPSFAKHIIDDSRHNNICSITDYFVFPQMYSETKTKYDRSDYIDNTDDFIQKIVQNRILYINGDSNSGKTTLLRHMYIALSQSHLPLLWDASTLRVSAKNLTKTLFETQYGKKAESYEKYQQADKSLRILLIDNWDVISEENKPKILGYLVSNYGHIVIAQRLYNDDENDVEKALAIGIKEDAGEQTVYQLSPFYLRKRNQLIHNICIASGIQSEEIIQGITDTVSALIQNHTSMFTLSPDFIIQYTQYFISNSSVGYQKSEEVFSLVFEHNITSQLLSATSKNNVEEYLFLLEEIAYSMFSTRMDHLSSERIQEIVQNYNSEYGNNVMPRRFVETMFASKIFLYSGNGFDITFSNRNYLSYFIARCMFRNVANGGGLESFEYCAKYACFGLNADIILFFTYISKSTNIISTISKATKELMHEWEILNIDEGNIPYLINGSLFPQIQPPSSQDRKVYEDFQEKREIDANENYQITPCGVFDYDEAKVETLHNSLRRAAVYLDILAKSLPAFNSTMRLSVKRDIVELLYCNPKRLLSKMLMPVAENYESICNGLKELVDTLFEEGEIKKKYDLDEIKLFIRDFSFGVILGTLDRVAQFSVDPKTILILKEYDDDNPLSQIQKMLFIHNSGKSDELFEETIKLLEHEKRPYMRMMLKAIIRRHLITNSSIPHNKRQSVIDQVFGNNARRDFLLPPTPTSN